MGPLNLGILIYLVDTLHVPLRVPRIALKGVQGPYYGPILLGLEGAGVVYPHDVGAPECKVQWG